MASLPVDPVIRLPYDDAYKISSRDMEILRQASAFKYRAEYYERVLWKVVDILGCGGPDDGPYRFIPAADELQDNDREALDFLKEVLASDV